MKRRTRLGHPLRVLYVTSCWPREGSFGGELRSSNVLHALQQVGAVEVCVLEEDTRPAALPFGFHEPAVAQVMEVNRAPNRGMMQRLRWTLDPRSDFPNGRRVNDAAMQSALRNLDEFDLVWFFQLRSPDAFPNTPWRRSVVDIDNIPSMYERAILEAGCGLRERVAATRRLVSLRRRERLLGERFTVLAVCSGEDRDYLRHIGIEVPIHIVPNGFEAPATEPVRNIVVPPRLGFIGLFEYAPNRQGIDWFIRECWPQIKREVPAARLRLAGTGSDGPLQSVGPDIDRLGWLANPAVEIATWSAMLVPVRGGAGTRVKIAHGFSEKCPIVSTTLGARGYGAVDGHQMYLADTAEAFSAACVRAIRQPEEARRMADAAWHEFIEKWTWEAIGPRVWAAADDCLRLNA